MRMLERRTRQRHQAGVTLIELMVAMTLGLMLLASFLALHYSTRSSFNALQATTQLQQNARFALLEMRRDIRMAGAFGCAASAPVYNPAGNSNAFASFNTANGVMVYSDSAALGSIFSASDSVAAGSPILEVQYGRGGGVITAGNASPTITELTVQLPSLQSFDASTPVLAIASCGRVDIVAQAMTAANAASNTYTLANLPSLPNNASAAGNHDGTIEALQFITRYYYVKNSSGSHGLYVKALADDGTVADTPVAENVTAMQVELGAINAPSNAAPTIQYAGTCGGGGVACNQVGLVRVGLTLTSSSVLQAGSSSAKLSQLYNTTIALRNHGLSPQ